MIRRNKKRKSSRKLLAISAAAAATGAISQVANGTLIAYEPFNGYGSVGTNFNATTANGNATGFTTWSPATTNATNQNGLTYSGLSTSGGSIRQNNTGGQRNRVTVPTVERGFRDVVFWSIEIAGLSPSIESTSGFSIIWRNWRAYALSDST